MEENLINKAWEENPTHRHGFMEMFFKRHGEMLKRYVLSECLVANKNLDEMKIKEILNEDD